MKSIFDKVSFDCSKNVTRSYSTSFSTAVGLLSPTIRQDIYNIYGFVRFADEIVDTFHDYNKEDLFNLFEDNLEHALKNKISLNPILNSFQHTVNKYQIPNELIDAFMKSMKLDLFKTNYSTTEEYKEYIYGSADVVGLMCLKVFVDGDTEKYENLKGAAMKLGSAFQKVNFLRDLKDDYEVGQNDP
jgi:phytoene/squalene synthetase